MRKIWLISLQIIILLSINIKHVYANISLNYSEVSVGVNKSIKLNISGNTSGTLTWNSSNKSVATVSNGTVTGLATGTSYISVSDGTYTASCKVMVVSNYVAVSEISLSESSGTIGVNGTKKISASVKPSNATNKKISYSSSDTGVATVDSSGLITAKKAGMAYITLIAEDKTASYKIMVVGSVALKGISVSPQTLELNENGSGKLNVSYNPSDATNKKVTWKSDDPNIATVDGSGNVKAVGPGTTTITVIANDNAHTAKATVTVNALDKTLKGISLNKKELTLDVGKTETLTITYNPANAENKEVTWKSSNSMIVSVENGKLTAKKPGTVTITVTSSDGDYKVTCQVKVPSPPIETIEFKEAEQTVYLGTETELEMVTTPEGAIIEDAIWTSSDEKVAIVENDILRALSIGTATITISDKEGKLTASTIVNVEAEPEKELKISVSGYELKFNPSVKEYTLTIGKESSLQIIVNRDSNKVVIGGNRDLQNGSIITVAVDDETYVINIKKKASYVLYFIVVITILLIVNIIRIVIKSKKKD